VDEPVVVELTPEETHPLRLAVLRFDTPSKEVEFAEDTWPGAVHLGVRIGDELVATSTWVPRELDGEPGVQLRGMATDRPRQSTGIGGLLLEEGCVRMAAAGHSLVWARARDAALDFYVRHGFAVVGDGFVDATTQLPHHVVVRRVRS
jgi:GNAT superfamily N-acetyltransferase